ncbi:MAG: energy transducer TonB [Planctomycetaceae bacterium]|nr:energy transducer TonB [Planctomycetaceae bacterium]
MKRSGIIFTLGQGSIRLFAFVAGIAGMIGLMLVLPLLESITSTPPSDLMLQSIATANVPPPPPPQAEEEKPEQEEQPQEAEPPKLAEDAPPLDLSMLELALNPGTGGAGLGGDFAVRLPVGDAKGDADEAGGVDELFSMSDLDQKPRAIYQVSPQTNPKLQKAAPATVYVLFVVDQRGRVESPIVQSSTDPQFEAPALAAVKQWKFEPGKRNGQAVKFRMRVPITFPKKA